MNPKIINLLDFEYPSILHNNESEQILMKAVNSRKTKLVLKIIRSVLNVKESIRKDILKKAIKLFGKNGTIKKLNRLIQMHSNNNPKAAAIFHNDMLYIKTLQ